MDIEQCIYYNIVTVWFLFIIQSINLPPSALTITSSAHCSTLQHTATLCNLQPSIQYISSAHYIFSAHCSHVQSCTAICSKSSVHTAANCSHLQPPTLQLCYSVHTAANCSHLQPPTLQLCYSVHTAAIMYDANTIQYIQ